MLFGNNMSWLYGKLKKKLDAPAETGSAGDVLTLGESGKPEWGEGGGGLPEVTSTDEGKVLTVVENSGEYEWSAATPAGGGALVIELHEEEIDLQDFYVMNKTAAEIIASMPLAYVLEPYDEEIDHFYSPVVAWAYIADPDPERPGAYYFFLDISGANYYSCESLSDYPMRSK